MHNRIQHVLVLCGCILFVPIDAARVQQSLSTSRKDHCCQLTGGKIWGPSPFKKGKWAGEQEFDLIDGFTCISPKKCSKKTYYFAKRFSGKMQKISELDMSQCPSDATVPQCSDVKTWGRALRARGKYLARRYDLRFVTEEMSHQISGAPMPTPEDAFEANWYSILYMSNPSSFTLKPYLYGGGMKYWVDAHRDGIGNWHEGKYRYSEKRHYAFFGLHLTQKNGRVEVNDDVDWTLSEHNLFHKWNSSVEEKYRIHAGDIVADVNRKKGNPTEILDEYMLRHEDMRDMTITAIQRRPELTKSAELKAPGFQNPYCWYDKNPSRVFDTDEHMTRETCCTSESGGNPECWSSELGYDFRRCC